MFDIGSFFICSSTTKSKGVPTKLSFVGERNDREIDENCELMRAIK